nr:phage head closure protein [uncultured Romboutsia sp.]
MVFDKPIVIEKMDEETEKYSEFASLKAIINKSKGSEYMDSGAVQISQELEFIVRYFSKLKDISLNTQLYRIIYDGIKYDIQDYDNYMLKNQTIKLIGVY